MAIINVKIKNITLIQRHAFIHKMMSFKKAVVHLEIKWELLECKSIFKNTNITKNES